MVNPRRRRPVNVVAVSLVLLLSPSFVKSLQFVIPPSATRCISDEISAEDSGTMKIRMVGRVAGDLEATVYGPEGEVVFSSVIASQPHSVPIPPNTYGMYRSCFINKVGERQRVEVLTTEMVDEQIKMEFPMKQQLRPLQQLFRRAELTVEGVSTELDRVRHREADLRKTSERTDSRIQWFSIFSIFILLAVSTWQMVYLRSFFRSKKLL